MQGISRNLEEARKAFGTRERAIGSLNAILTPKGVVKHDALTKLSELTGQDFVSKLDEFKNAKSLLEESRRGDMREKLTPELFAKVKRLEESVAQAEAAYAPFQRLSQNSTWSKVRGQGFANPNPEDRKALEALAAATGTDYLTLIKDRHVLDGFFKERTNGSRRTLLGTIVGNVAAGPVGGVVGSILGASVDTHGGEILKKLLDANRNVSGLLFSEKAMKRAAERLDDIPEMLGRMSKKAKPKYARAATSTALARLMLSDADADALPEQEAQRPARLKRMDDFNSKASEWTSNPHAAAAKLAELTSPISNGGAPEIGAAFGRKANTALSYLHAAVPKAPRPRSPFAPKVEYVPPQYEMAAFEDKVQAATDPFSVLVELEHGTLTRHHVEALQAVYPGLLRMIQMKVQEAVVSGVEPLEYSQRVKLSTLLGVPLDTSLSPDAVNYYQEAYVAVQEAESQQAEGKSVNVASQYMNPGDERS
jgi:hypothetical protein